MKRESTLFSAVTVEKREGCQWRGVVFMDATENGTLLPVTHKEGSGSQSFSLGTCLSWQAGKGLKYFLFPINFGAWVFLIRKLLPALFWKWYHCASPGTYLRYWRKGWSIFRESSRVLEMCPRIWGLVSAWFLLSYTSQTQARFLGKWWSWANGLVV